MKKQRLLAAATALTLSLSFAACSSGATPAATGSAGGTAAASKGEVTVWMYPVIADEAASRTFWQKAETDFEAKNAGIDLKVELQPWKGRDEQVATAIASNRGPDLVLLTPDSLPGFAASGGLKSLKSVNDPAFLPAAVEAATVDGEMYAVPLYHTVVAPTYNKKALADKGIMTLPTTWDELKADAEKLKGSNVALMDYAGTATLNMTFYPLLWQAGGSVFAEDGKKVAFNSDAGRQALQLLVDLNNLGALPKDAATRAGAVEGSGLTNGSTIMSPYAVKADAMAMQKALGAENVQVGPVLKNKEQVTFGLPGLLARTSISEDNGTSEKVAQFLASKEFQTELAKASGYFPARSDATVDTSNALNAPFSEALKHVKAGEVHPQSRQVMAALTPHIQAALQGTKTVEQALKDAETEANGQIKA